MLRTAAGPDGGEVRAGAAAACSYRVALPATLGLKNPLTIGAVARSSIGAGRRLKSSRTKAASDRYSSAVMRVPGMAVPARPSRTIVISTVSSGAAPRRRTGASARVGPRPAFAAAAPWRHGAQCRWNSESPVSAAESTPRR